MKKCILVIGLFSLVFVLSGCSPKEKFYLHDNVTKTVYFLNEIDEKTGEVYVIPPPEVADESGKILDLDSIMTGVFPDITKAGLYVLEFNYKDPNGNVYESHIIEYEILKRELELNYSELTKEDGLYTFLIDMNNVDDVRYRLDVYIDNQYYDTYENTKLIDGLEIVNSIEIRVHLLEDRGLEDIDIRIQTYYYWIGE